MVWRCLVPHHVVGTFFFVRVRLNLMEPDYPLQVGNCVNDLKHPLPRYLGSLKSWLLLSLSNICLECF